MCLTFRAWRQTDSFMFTAELPKPSWHGYGQSTVIDAGGRVVTRPQPGGLGKLEDSKQGIIMADLPLPNAAEHP